MKYEAHIVSHTHWDREWYSTFQEYRIRLVNLVDKLLHILETIPEYKYFVFDGQTVLLDDYLEIKSENRDRLEKFIKKGRLLVGPWYTLPDEFLVSGESIVRNLLIGHKIAQQFGKVMKSGYIPDPFGHISQLPQILFKFGIDSVIFTRGLGDEGEKLGSEFLWKAPDGSEVIAIHQIWWYGNFFAPGYIKPDATGNSKEPLNLPEALNKAELVKADLIKYAKTKYLLFNNGVDHYEPQPELPQIIQYLNDNMSDCYFLHSNFEQFINKIKSNKVEFGQYTGEFRSARYVALLPGVLSTRMYLKQANERTQTLLEKFTEPLVTMAYLNGMKYPQEFIYQAWKYLLQCHPHDSICGCSIDNVHRDVIRRLSWTQEIANRIKEQAISFLLDSINTYQPSNEPTTPIVVFNTLNWSRTEPVTVDLIFRQDGQNTIQEQEKNFAVYDEHGKVSSVIAGDLSDLLWTPWLNYYKKREITFLADNIPPCGYKVYWLRKITAEQKLPTKELLISGKNFIENEYYRITAHPDGTIRIRDKVNRTVYEQLHILEDVEDAGDEYNYSPLKNSFRIISTKGKAKVSTIKNDISASIKIDLKLSIPAGLTPDRKTRSKKLVIHNISTEVRLHPGSHRIDFCTTLNNQSKDHRLRILFPTNIETDHTYTEGQFNVVKRKISLPAGRNWSEQPCPTMPQQSFVSISDGKKGLTLINQGLPEYEAIKKQGGTVTLALTLLRCVGWLSRDDLLTRQGHAGHSLPTVDSQCIGVHKFKYALVLHSGTWKSARVWQQAYNHKVELIGEMTDIHKGNNPHELSFIKIEPENKFVISAVKKAERDDKLVIRFYNTTRQETTAKVILSRKINRVELTNLNEEPVNSSQVKLDSANGVVKIPSIRPFEINTLSIE